MTRAELAERLHREAAEIEAARYADAAAVLAALERGGSVRIGPAGAVLYSGRPLSAGLLLAVSQHAATLVRLLAEGPWVDREILRPATRGGGE